MEFSDKLLDRVARAMYEHDPYDDDNLPSDWHLAEPGIRRNYLGFAQVALGAALDAAGAEEQFVVCGAMPIEGHPDYKFCSDVLPAIEHAEDLLRVWTEQHGGRDGANFTIEHSVKVLVNTLRYWTEADLQRIDAIAKKRAEELARYAK